jgi:stringent starvation protein B
MLSNRPYLLRAFHQWIVDSKCTPIMVLDANNPRCKFPADHAEGGEIVFNVSSTAVRDLKMTNYGVEFKASFSGVVQVISAPIKAVMAVYAEENGEGIFFEAEADDGTDLYEVEGIDNAASATAETQTAAADPAIAPQQKAKPFLKLVE